MNFGNLLSCQPDNIKRSLRNIVEGIEKKLASTRIATVFNETRKNEHRLPTFTNIYIIIYHDFLPTPRRGSHVKSGKTHTQSSRYTP